MTRCVCGSVFTRYLGLPLLGAIVGAGVALAIFVHSSADNPRYVASVPFQVLPPPGSISGENPPDRSLNQDDAAQVIRRQMFIFRQDAFLRDVMASAEFHPQDKPNHECAWLASHKSDPMKYLKHDLVIVPDIESATFEVRMTSRDPVESLTLVQAAIKVYLQRLASDSQMRRNKFLVALDAAVMEKQSDFELKTAALIDYSKRNNVDVLKTSYEVTKSSLTDLNREYTLADASAKTAEENYKFIQQKAQNHEDISLPSELQQSVENDSTLKTLLNTRLTWEQDKSALADTVPIPLVPTPRTSAEIDGRIKIIDRQIADINAKLTVNARAHYVTLLRDEATSKRNLADYINKDRKDKEDRVTHIGQNLLVWQQRVDEVKQTGDIVAKLRYQYSLAQANRATDDTRISKLDDPVLPDKPADFDWAAFQPKGILWAAIGLVAGFLVAWPLAFRHTRRDLPTPAAPPSLPTGVKPV